MDVATSTPAAETAEVKYEPWIRKRTCPTPLKTSSVQKKIIQLFRTMEKKEDERSTIIFCCNNLHSCYCIEKKTCKIGRKREKAKERKRERRVASIHDGIWIILTIL